MEKVSKFSVRIFSHRYFPIGVVILAILLTLPALGVGLLLDDLYIREVILERETYASILDSPWGIFKVADGDPERARQMMDYGFVPWWVEPTIKANLMRPVTVVTHLFDYRLWPNYPTLMHLQSILWYGLIVGLVAVLYRRMMGFSWVAGFAALLFAIDDGHNFPVAYLAGRNQLLYLFFAVLTILVHDHWRKDNWQAGAIFGPMIFILSILSHELGVGTFAYLIAYEVFIDKTKWKKRCLVLLPYLTVVVGWRIIYAWAGYGISGIAYYVDPLHEPVRYLEFIIARFPVYILSQWALPPAEIMLLLSDTGNRRLWFVACGFLMLLMLLLAPLLRRDQQARFWAGGMVLSILPICAGFPGDFRLVLASVGGMGLLSRFLAMVFDKFEWQPRNTWWRGVAKIMAIVFILIHVILAPVMLGFRSGMPTGGTRKIIKEIQNHLPNDSALAEKNMVIINPPLPFYLAIDEDMTKPVPRHSWALASGISPLSIQRVDDRTLKVYVTYGYLSGILDRLMRRVDLHPMKVGDQVKLSGMTVEVTNVWENGEPVEAAFRFDVLLEDESLYWLYWDWQSRSYQEFILPAVGQKIELAGYLK